MVSGVCTPEGGHCGQTMSKSGAHSQGASRADVLSVRMASASEAAAG